MKRPSSVAMICWFCMLANMAAEVKCVLDISQVPVAGTTFVWTPLGQLTWDAIVQQNGEFDRVDPRNTVIERLMCFEWKEQEVMPKNDYAVYVGAGTEKFIKETAAEVKRRFGFNLSLSETLIGNEILAIGILKNQLKYTKDFYSLSYIDQKFKGRKGLVSDVEYWGCEGKASGNFRELVDVLSYRDHGREFAVSIKTKHQDGRIIIYKPRTVVSLFKSFQHVKDMKVLWEKGKPDGMSVHDTKLHEMDSLVVPRLKLKLDADLLSDLLGNIYYKKRVSSKIITEARQIIEFELNETGGRTQAEAYIGDGWGEDDTPKPVVRRFVCDGPFYVYMWREGADLPYLAMLVDSGDVFDLSEPSITSDQIR